MGGYGHHDLIERPAPTARIWRYFDFAKLVDMLDLSTLHFARADRMIDPWEGSLSEFMESAHAETFRQEIESLDSAITVEQREDVLNDFLPEYRAWWLSTRKKMFLSCWYMADHESAAMWDLYGGREGRGVAIQSTFGQLEVALPSEFPYAIYAGKVRYIDYRQETIPLGNVFSRFLHKRLSFEHEHEIRALIDIHGEDPPAGLSVPVELSTLVEKVHVSPLAADWFLALVQRTVASHELDIPVVRSDLLTGPVA